MHYPYNLESFALNMVSSISTTSLLPQRRFLIHSLYCLCFLSQYVEVEHVLNIVIQYSDAGCVGYSQLKPRSVSTISARSEAPLHLAVKGMDDVKGLHTLFILHPNICRSQR